MLWLDRSEGPSRLILLIDILERPAFASGSICDVSHDE